MKLILIGVILITLFTNTTMAKNKKNINWRKIMTSDEAYTYIPPKKKKKKSMLDIFDITKGSLNYQGGVKIKLFSKGGKVK